MGANVLYGIKEEYESRLFTFSDSLRIDGDLHFLYDLVQEGDLFHAIAISCVFWKYLRNDPHAVKEVQKWLQCCIDILSVEEMYEEIVMIRRIAHAVGIQNNEYYVTFHMLFLSIESGYYLSDGNKT